ncbi:hypothetical protein AOC36_07120 [Erysipelothrix larvae]|uniref:VOC domain-containing protein n=1 Tax=Erysipelothrix larvae TaxID=1514105 RepID=A0A0X8H0D5_9FIRM|nr:VOC family protein [Erysipelothrix larvae]AMC93762.1 hypothetical protein AOC36_07120 [Erysipelothrix larvae]
MNPLMNTMPVLGDVGLRVQDLNRSLDYYTRILGLTLIEKTETSASLGVNQTPIIHLRANASWNHPSKPYTGLYHIAILLPDEADLGQILYHFAREGYQIDGAGDHLYSQALYMHDPDGNGIEIYADRPMDTWNVHDDGTVETDTQPVNLQRLVDMVHVESWDGLPDGTILGHMHLEVKDLKAHEAFYVNLLGYDIKTVWGNTALFISKNGYHHHIGANTWERPVDTLPDDVTGLDYMTLYVDDLNHLEETLDGVKRIDDQSITVRDPNGITLILKQY